MLPRVSHLQANSIYRKLLYIRQSRHKRALKHRGKLKTHQKENVTASKNASAKNQHRQRVGIKGVNTRRSRGSCNIRDDILAS